ncbi:HNH endonuclease [Carboxylicivirga sp. N1Y90]|uniref:HNH endonuclease n=1 Tax=Carboxylicivirga fragile TaxID=3417571 RepID=UPI003D343350|nr:hypothetical protein [Marinilabiliaceae bacterium N1Y90]
MRSLPIPDEDITEIYTTCISKVRNPDLKQRLSQCGDIIEEANTEYDTVARSGELHLIESGVPEGIDITNEELVKVYTSRMVPKKSPGRPYYDKIITSTPHSRCPLCGHRTVTTLDHHLPKAHYPLLSISPINLIPACKDCNTAKDDIEPNSKQEVTIHPYYDNIEKERWLKALVIDSKPVAILFFVEHPKEWDDILFERVKLHFSVLDLNTLYASHAAEELVNIQFSLLLQYEVGGSNAVKDFLEDAAESRQMVHPNSWQTALYQALAASDWFCNEGFNEL